MFSALALINALVVSIPYSLYSLVGASQFQTIAVWLNTTCTAATRQAAFPNLNTVDEIVSDTYVNISRYLISTLYSSILSLCLTLLYYMLKPGQDKHNFTQDQLSTMTANELDNVLGKSMKQWWHKGRVLFGVVVCTTFIALISALFLFGFYYSRFAFYPDYGDYCRNKSSSYRNISVSVAISLFIGFSFFYVLL